MNLLESEIASPEQRHAIAFCIARDCGWDSLADMLADTTNIPRQVFTELELSRAAYGYEVGNRVGRGSRS